MSDRQPVATTETADGATLLQELLNRTTEISARLAAPVVQPMELRTFEELERWAERAARSTMVPYAYKGKPDDIILAVQMGSELGLRPMQSLQNIATINGKPSVYGDAMLALCMGHPLYVSTEEWIEGEGDARKAVCRTVRKGTPPVVRTFSVPDAKTAKLWGKKGRDGQDTPWITNPDRMLQLRARGFALRDAFPDKLRGLISAEEAGDYDMPAASAAPAAPPPRQSAPTEARRPSARQWLADLEQDLIRAAEEGAPAVEARLAANDVQAALAALQNGAKAELQRLIDTARAGYTPSDAAFIADGERMET